jgi:hypothetical protein
MSLTPEHFVNFVRDVREKGMAPPFMPHLLMYNPTGEVGHVPIPDFAMEKKDREKLVRVLHMMLKIHKADSYIWISEAWLAKCNPIRPYPFVNNIDKDPEKIEVVIFMATCADGTKHGRAFELLPERKLGDPFLGDANGPIVLSGWFANLLTPDSPDIRMPI